MPWLQKIFACPEFSGVYGNRELPVTHYLRDPVMLALKRNTDILIVWILTDTQIGILSTGIRTSVSDLPVTIICSTPVRGR